MLDYTNKKKLLMLSSYFFLIPSIYGFYHKVYYLSILSNITTIISCNYWRNAIPGFNKNLDLYFSKLSFIIYFLTGILKIRNIFIFQLGCLNTVMIFFCYSMSNHLYLVKSNNWIYFHMAFHLFVAIGQLIVIYGSYILI